MSAQVYCQVFKSDLGDWKEVCHTDPSHSFSLFLMRFLTGIKPTGQLHLGNYVGAMRPFLKRLEDPCAEAFLMIADGHALTGCKDGEVLRAQTRHIAAAWLALGLDPERVTFYRQSQVREVFELFWLLCCVCPKGLMQRAHAYKAALDQSPRTLESADSAVLMGLYNYPILMAADILLFGADYVPVGNDQRQHVEIARDLAGKMNQTYGKNVLHSPQAMIDDKNPTLLGLDGRKMSKSYGNTIPLFATDEMWKKLIFRIKTTSQRPEEPKDPKNCLLFSLYSLFASSEACGGMACRYETGIGWAEMKQHVFSAVQTHLKSLRDRYADIVSQPKLLDEALAAGEEKARHVAKKRMHSLREVVGF